MSRINRALQTAEAFPKQVAAIFCRDDYGDRVLFQEIGRPLQLVGQLVGSWVDGLAVGREPKEQQEPGGEANDPPSGFVSHDGTSRREKTSPAGSGRGGAVE